MFVAKNWDDLWLEVIGYAESNDSWFSAKAIKVVCFYINWLGKVTYWLRVTKISKTQNESDFFLI